MSLGEFLSDRLCQMAAGTAAVLGAAVFLLVTGTQSGVVALLLVFGLLVFILREGVLFFRCRSRLRELTAIMEGLDQKYLFAECVPRARSLYERRLLELMRESGKSMIGRVSEVEAAGREYREYVESWVHEIKAPITAAELISRGVEKEAGRKLLKELAQIENHVERALFYARAENPERDFLIRQTKLETLVSETVQNHRALLISAGVRVETEGLTGTVYTDGKWAGFLLGQLLQNAVRYRREEPVITICASPMGKRMRLAVKDNGMGIPAHELSRVWDRGFTGSNGRTRGGATGMGLYLCRKIAGFLEIELEIASGQQEGTEVTVIFPARESS